MIVLRSSLVSLGLSLGLAAVALFGSPDSVRADCSVQFSDNGGQGSCEFVESGGGGTFELNDDVNLDFAITNFRISGASIDDTGAWEVNGKTVYSEYGGCGAANNNYDNGIGSGLTHLNFKLTVANGCGGNYGGNLSFSFDKQLENPTVSVTANNAQDTVTVPYGGSVTIAWNSAHAASCSGSGNFSPNGPLNGSGSTTIASVIQNLSFTVSCSNARGSANSSVSVVAGPQPSITGLTPLAGLAGTQATLSGIALPASGNSVILTPSSGTATPIPNIAATSGTTMVFTVPATLAPGPYTVTAKNAAGTVITSSQTLTFTVILPSSPLSCVTGDAGKQTTDDFESFTDGATQDFGWRTIVHPSTSVTVKKDQGKSGKGLVLVDTNAAAGYEAHALAERQIKKSPTGTISFDVKPSQTTGRFTFVLGGAKGDFFYGYLSPTGTVEVWNDAVTSGSKYVRIGTATYTASQWVTVKLDWNGTSKTVDLSMNGTKINSQPIPYSYLANASNVTYFQSFTGHGESWTGTYAIDNVTYPGCVGLTLSVSPTSGTAPLAVTATAANVATGSELGWEFGDSSAKVSGTSITATHTYQTAGTYTLKLTGGGQTLSQTITVNEVVIPPAPPAPPAPTPTPNPIPFSLTITPTSGDRPLKVTGSVSSADASTKLSWDFGDGITTQTDGNAQVVHTYTNPGEYIVIVTQGTQRSTATVRVTGDEPAPIVRVMRLASTGGSLTVNLALATLLSLGTTYTLLRRKGVGMKE